MHLKKLLILCGGISLALSSGLTMADELKVVDINAVNLQDLAADGYVLIENKTFKRRDPNLFPTSDKVKIESLGQKINADLAVLNTTYKYTVKAIRDKKSSTHEDMSNIKSFTDYKVYDVSVSYYKKVS
ncbi:hypothetical protein M3084_02250 [Succinatimonas hippei]|uniref:hypothetical protein n=1 Tax=Succinatimonas hippei TaxID=626938 RepID=UPI00201217D3|nr:hypothetical protein [Succinatimonas hippei]MCL1602668.1 hypothetical protein [Succinatimonas hippei]